MEVKGAIVLIAPPNGWSSLYLGLSRSKKKRRYFRGQLQFAACRPAPLLPAPQFLSPLTQQRCSDRTVVRLKPAATGRFTTAIRPFTSSVSISVLGISLVAVLNCPIAFSSWDTCFIQHRTENRNMAVDLSHWNGLVRIY